MKRLGMILCVLALCLTGCSPLDSYVASGEAYYLRFDTVPQITFWDYFPEDEGNPIFDTIEIDGGMDSPAVAFLFQGEPLNPKEGEVYGDEVANLLFGVAAWDGAKHSLIQLKKETTSSIVLVYQGTKFTLPLNKEACLQLLPSISHTEGWRTGLK